MVMWDRVKEAWANVKRYRELRHYRNIIIHDLHEWQAHISFLSDEFDLRVRELPIISRFVPGTMLFVPICKPHPIASQQQVTILSVGTNPAAIWEHWRRLNNVERPSFDEEDKAEWDELIINLKSRIEEETGVALPAF